jgi:hypothetical protein
VDSCADGVGRRKSGDAEPAVSSVRRADVGSSQAVVGPPVAERGQIGEDHSESRFSCISPYAGRCSDSGDVLEDDVPGMNLAKGCGNAEPDLSVVSFDSCSPTGEAVVGAGESSADEIDFGGGGPVEREEVSMIRDSRVVVVEDDRAVRVGFRKPDPFDSERAGKTEIQSSPASAERSAAHGHAASS